MARIRRTVSGLGILATAAAIATLGASTFVVSGADHLDAPTAKSDSRIDITDIYAFKSTGGTTLIMNVNPLTSPADTKTARLRTQALYELYVDTNGNALADIVYRVKFSNTRMLASGSIVQDYAIKRATGSAAQRHEWSGVTVATGRTTGYGENKRIAAINGGGKAFAGPRDDPFFFDLAGFVEFKTQLLAGSTDLGVLLGGFTGHDTFAGTNVTSIAIEVPNAKLGGTGKTVGIWATTSIRKDGVYQQADRMARPAINTVFNNTKAEKEAANRLRPSDDRAFDHDNVVAVLDAIDNVLEANSAPSYTDVQIQGLADVLLPDLLTVKLGDASGFLNGRRPADDVINAEFSVLTNGNVTSDGVDANDRGFPARFPYLPSPN